MKLENIDLKRGIGSRDIYVNIEADLICKIDELYSGDINYEYSRRLPCGNMMYLLDMDDEGILIGQSRFIDFKYDRNIFDRFDGNVGLYRDIWECVWVKLNL